MKKLLADDVRSLWVALGFAAGMFWAGLVSMIAPMPTLTCFIFFGVTVLIVAILSVRVFK
jgi:hypothetical protein